MVAPICFGYAPGLEGSMNVSPSLDSHQHAVAAMQAFFRLFPREAAEWLICRTRPLARRVRVLSAEYIEQVPRGPSYVVPAPPPMPEVASTRDEVVKQVVLDAIEREVAESDASVKVIEFDLEEARRQALLLGGCDIELKVRIEDGKRSKPYTLILGVPLPGPDNDGSQMPFHLVGKVAWHMLAHQQLIAAGEPAARTRGPMFDFAPLYLWPFTGLKDPQEDCSVFSSSHQAKGLLGDLLRSGDASQRDQDKKYNRERLEYHRRRDRERRAARERRLQWMREGNGGISDEELDALVPAIDVDKDQITMRLAYEVIRLWEEPAETLVKELPGECLGLSLFGHRPEGSSAAEVLRRAAWALRGRMPGADATRLLRAASALAAIASIHLPAEEVQSTLESVKLGT